MVVPNRVLGVALAISASLAVLMLAGLGAGSAAADPTDPGDPNTTSEPPTGEPQPTSTAPTPDLPGAIAGVLNDLLHKPFSIFGNGRVPGDPPKPVVVNPDGSTAPTRQRGRDDPTSKPDEPELRPIEPEPNWSVPQRKPSSSVKVVLPFAPPVAIALPPVPVAGHENLRLTLDLTDPYTALASVQETTKTINSLLADAYAPYNPFKPPAPEPQPTFKILQEEPVVEAGGGQGNRGAQAAESAGDLPVLQAPGMVPPVRIAMPRPATAPSGAGPQVPGTGPAVSANPVDARGPAPRGSVTEPGSTANASASAMGRPAVRQGYRQYLQSARTGQVAAIAVPGLMGLLASVATGVVTGYRQANSQRYVRADAARFLP